MCSVTRVLSGSFETSETSVGQNNNIMSKRHVDHRNHRAFRDAVGYNATIMRYERSPPLPNTVGFRHLVAARKAFERSVNACAKGTGCDPHVIQRDAARKYGIAPNQFQGKGAYRRPRGGGRGRRRVGFEGILNKPGGREYLSRQYWRDYPSGGQPWWATRNPRDQMVEELAMVHQHNPATAAAIGTAIAAAFGQGLAPPVFAPSGGLPGIRTRPRSQTEDGEFADPGLNTSRRLDF